MPSNLKIRGSNGTWKECYDLNKNDVITALGYTPLENHQSLSNYVTINTEQTITGTKTFKRDVLGIIKIERTNTPYASAINFSNSNGTLGYVGMTGSANGGLYRWETDTTKSHKIWDDGNDGANSGLDADLLDGQQGSYYLDYNNFVNTPTFVTATKENDGLMSSADKGNLDTLVSLLSDNDSDTTVNTIQEVLNVFKSFPEETTITNALSLKMDKTGGEFSGGVTFASSAYFGNSSQYIKKRDDTNVLDVYVNGNRVFAFGATSSEISSHLRPNSNKSKDLGRSEYWWNNIYGTTIYENGTSLSSKYLGINGVATDSDKLNGKDSSYYLDYENLENKPEVVTLYITDLR